MTDRSRASATTKRRSDDGLVTFLPCFRAKASAGFTLLEVLIALAVLAISSLAIIGQVGQSLSRVQQLQLQTSAIVVAENQMTVIQISPDWPGLGVRTNRVTLADAQWLVQTDVSTTSDPWLRKVEITVNYDEQAGSRETPAILARLISYRGLH
ncbi:MAG: type II secretion system minor pseudopilin GspI [Oceanicoccus sp.]